MAQAHEVRERLCAAYGFATDMVEIVAVTASGDKVQDRPLAEIGGKALWTKELDAWLMTGAIDFAVHSAKDVETIRPARILMAAILPREDVRDALIGANSIAALPPSATVGTSAPRRAAQLLHFRPDCRVVPIRGNVATRLAKLNAGDVDATFLAAAGLNRLGEHRIGARLDPADWLPAPGQAAITIECRTDDDQTRTLLSALDDPRSHGEVKAERALLTALGGTCHSPIAVLTHSEGDNLHMQASLFSPDGVERVDGKARFHRDDARAPAQLGADLLARAGSTITAHFTGLQEARP